MHSHSQRDFNSAISWWLATGIAHKEENYLRTHHTSPVYKLLDGCYWTWENEKHVRGDETPLKMEFLLLPFILLGCGLLPSTLLFWLELLHQRCKRRPVTQSDQGPVAINSAVLNEDDEMRMKMASAIMSEEGAILQMGHNPSQSHGSKSMMRPLSRQIKLQMEDI